MRKWTTIAAGLAAAARLAGLAAPAASAATHAVTPQDTRGYFTLCDAAPGYSSTASFPDRGGLSTYIVPPGRCDTIHLGGTVNEQVNVWKIVRGGRQYIGSTIYNGLRGERITTVTGPSFYVS